MHISYAENSVKSKLPVTDTHIINFSNKQNTTPADSVENPPADAENQINITVRQSDEPLSAAIRKRTSALFRTNKAVQAAVNRRLLGGFEGFNGELSRLWDNIGIETRETTIRKLAKDKLRNDRQRRVKAGLVKIGDAESRDAQKIEGESKSANGLEMEEEGQPQKVIDQEHEQSEEVAEVNLVDQAQDRNTV